MTLPIELSLGDHATWKGDVTRTFQVLLDGPHDDLLQYLLGHDLWFGLDKELDLVL